MQTRAEYNRKQREYRARTGNVGTKLYEKTRKGYLMRTYRNMLSRVKGIQKLKAHLYEGKEILDKDDFYRWSLSDFRFNLLFDEWEEAGHILKLAPSIDRIDTSRGYALDNIQWITQSENSSKGAITRNSQPSQQSAN